MRLGIQQRVLPHFRAPLYDALAKKNDGPVEVFTGHTEKGEGVIEAASLNVAIWRQTKNRYIGWQGQRFYWQAEFGQWIERFRPDVLAVESNPRILSNYPGFKRARKLSIPVVGWGIGVMGNANDTGAYGAFMRKYFTQFAAMIAYGNKGAEDFRQLGVSPENIFVAPNSVSNIEADRLIKEGDQGRQAIMKHRQKLGLEKLPAVLFLGRLIAEKRVDLLLNAISLLTQPCELLVVGEGPIRQELESLAETLSVRARFLGHLTGRELALSISVADICILPGTGGLAVQEVMAFGKPVIVGSADGTQWDLVEEGMTGYHLRGETPQALADLLADCLTKPDLLLKMGVAARELIAKRHNMDLTVDIVLSSLKRARVV